MSPTEDNTKIEINFKRRETEAGWNKIWDDFGLKGTPVWFSWIGWILALAGLLFIYKQSKSISILILYVISMLMLWNYFVAFFYKIQFKGLPLIKSDRKAKLISILLSGILVFFSWQFVNKIVRTIVSYKQ